MKQCSRRRRGSGVAFAGLMASAILLSVTAQADQKQVCVQAFDKGQKLKREGKLQAARAALAECARDACPDLVRVECMALLSKVI